MTSILGLSGSLRRGSFNSALLRAASQLVPEGVQMDVQTLHGVPLYDGDLEAQSGIPQPVAVLKDKLRRADGLLIVTPEYNNSVPGVLKNALDWMSRPAADVGRVLRGTTVGIVGATPGRMGTVLAQAALLPTLRTLGMRLYTGGTLYVSRAGEAFDGDGRLQDDDLRERLRVYLQGLAGELTRSARSRGD